MRIARLTAATVALTAATVVATTGSASAAVEPPGGSWDHTFRTTGVVVYVEENGDIISVCDTSANGKPAYADVWVGNDPRYSMKVTKGKGSCVTHRAVEGGKYNLPEGKEIWVQYWGTTLSGGSGKPESPFVNDH